MWYKRKCPSGTCHQHCCPTLPLLLCCCSSEPLNSLHQHLQSEVTHSPQSAALLARSALVVRPSMLLLLALQERACPPRLSVGRRAVGLPPGQKLPSGQGAQLLLLPDCTWYVPAGHTAARKLRRPMCCQSLCRDGVRGVLTDTHMPAANSKSPLLYNASA